jgi:acyl dehydratase
MYFDDFEVGQVFETDRYIVRRSDILAFAERFDASPYHLDDDAAKAVGLPGIVASGFHTLSLSFKLFFELHLWDEAVMPSPGIDKVRWLKPLFPDETVWVRATVLDAKISKSKGDRGIVTMLHELLATTSQDPLLTVEAMHRLRLRPGDLQTSG